LTFAIGQQRGHARVGFGENRGEVLAAREN
jgi:hypothetical protein